MPCGCQVRTVENPWIMGKDDEIARLRGRVDEAVRTRREFLGWWDGDDRGRELKEAYDEEVRESRREWKRERVRWERE